MHLPLRIDCGRDTASTCDGETWEADQAVPPSEDRAPDPGSWFRVGGSTITRETVLPLHPPTYADIMRTECFGMQAYRFGVPRGIYRLHLFMAETFENLASLERRFAIQLNGQTVVEDVCPATIAGGFARLGVMAIDGIVAEENGIDLRFGPQAILSGLSLESSDRDSGLFVAYDALDPAPPPQRPTDSTTRRALQLYTIGHSGAFHWAIPHTLQRMIEMARPDLRVDLDAFYRGGQNAGFFVEAEEVAAGLARQPDHAIIMDSSWGPIEEPAAFATNMPRLIDRVRAAGVAPVLYAYHGPKRHSNAERRQLMERYRDMGHRFNVPVLPCAEALARFEDREPATNKHNPDLHHVGMEVGFLYACVWFRAFLGRSAAELPEYPILGGWTQLPPERARELAALADETCVDEGIGADETTALITLR